MTMCEINSWLRRLAENMVRLNLTLNGLSQELLAFRRYLLIEIFKQGLDNLTVDINE